MWLLVKPLFYFFSILLPAGNECLSWGGMCGTFVGLAPTSAQGTGPAGTGSGPRGDCAPAAFMELLAGVKGETFTPSTTLSSHRRIPTAGTRQVPQPCSAAGGSGSGRGPPPRGE